MSKLALTNLTPSQFVQTDASKNLVSYDLFNASPTYNGQGNWTSAQPSTFTATVQVGGLKGASLSTCNGGSNALTWSAGQFGCNTISGGGGGSSTLAVQQNAVNITSPTVAINFLNPPFVVSLVNGSTSQVALNPSSVTLQGVVTAASLGAITGNQSITWTGSGDVTGSASGATSISPTLTAAANQPNIKTLSASSTTVGGQLLVIGSQTVTGAGGLGVTYNINVGSMTGAGLSSCSAAGNAVNFNSTSNTFGCATGYLTANQSISVTGDSTGSGTTSIALTAAGQQANIKTLSASSVTVSGTSGLLVSNGVLQSTAIYVSSATVGFDEYENGNSGTSLNIDWTHSNEQRVTLTGNVTFTFTAPAHPMTLRLRLLTGAGSYTAAWPAAVHWGTAGTPTITATASKKDVVTCAYSQKDAEYDCVWVGNF